MEAIENLLDGYVLSEKRGALYYLTRYIKQAKVFKNYEKDIFIDDKNSSPTEKIKLLTKDLITLIEKTANKKVIEFTDKEFLFWMDSIADIEDNLDEEPDEKQVQNALKALSNFEFLLPIDPMSSHRMLSVSAKKAVREKRSKSICNNEARPIKPKEQEKSETVHKDGRKTKTIMDTTIRVMFNSEQEKDRFCAYVDRYDYRPVYNGRPEKAVGWMGDHRGNCRLYLDRRCVLNFEKLAQDIQMFGGRIEI